MKLTTAQLDRACGVLLAAQDAIVARWAAWAETARDVGIQTGDVLAAVRHGTAAEALAASAELHERTRHTAGNGSLMRTAPVALAYLHDDSENALTAAAEQLSTLTHCRRPEPRVGRTPGQRGAGPAA